MAECLTRKSSLNRVPTLHGKNGFIVSNMDKVEVLADHYKLVHHLTRDYGDLSTDRFVNQRYQEIAIASHDLELVELATPRKIKRACNVNGLKKSVGP